MIPFPFSWWILILRLCESFQFKCLFFPCIPSMRQAELIFHVISFLKFQAHKLDVASVVTIMVWYISGADSNFKQIWGFFNVSHENIKGGLIYLLITYLLGKVVLFLSIIFHQTWKFRGPLISIWMCSTLLSLLNYCCQN